MFTFVYICSKSLVSVDLSLHRGPQLRLCLLLTTPSWDKRPNLPPWLQRGQESSRRLRPAPSAPRPTSKPSAVHLLFSQHVKSPGLKILLQTKSPLWPQLYNQPRPQSQSAVRIILHLCQIKRIFGFVPMQKVFALMQLIRLELTVQRTTRTTNHKRRTGRLGWNQAWSKPEAGRLQTSSSTCPELGRGLAQPASLVVTGDPRAPAVSLLLSQPDLLGPSSPECPHCRGFAMWVHWHSWSPHSESPSRGKKMTFSKLWFSVSPPGELIFMSQGQIYPGGDFLHRHPRGVFSYQPAETCLQELKGGSNMATE